MATPVYTLPKPIEWELPPQEQAAVDYIAGKFEQVAAQMPEGITPLLGLNTERGQLVVLDYWQLNELLRKAGEK